MVSKEMVIENKSGLHVRPAGVLAKIALPFSCEVILVFNGKEYNAKSVLGIMSACVKPGDTVTFICKGEDEEAALAAIVEGVGSGLGE